MALTHTDRLRNLMADAIDQEWDGGTGRITILTGAAVAAGSAQTGTPLAAFTLPADAFAVPTAQGLNALNAVANVNATGSGTAGAFIMHNSDETAIGSVAGGTDNRITGTLGTSGTDMIIDNVTINSGGQLVMSGWSWQAPL